MLHPRVMRGCHAFAASILLFSAFSGSALAASAGVPKAPPIQVNLQSDVPVRGDFMLGPTRILVTMDPGEEKTVQVEVTNRGGRRHSYGLSTEDFSAGASEREVTHLYGSADGPFSARNWLAPAAREFEINHAERAYIPVTIRVPEDAEPGDHYTALMVQRNPLPGEVGISVISRVGSLFVITVRGEVIRQGSLLSITSRFPLYWSYPIGLKVTGKNDGTVHMVPQGNIRISNLLGLTVDEVQVKDWIVLRDSSRSVDVNWMPQFALGRYTATTDLSIFGENTQPLSVSFWVIPLLPVLIVLAAIFIVSFFVQFFFSRFEIRKK